MATLRPALQQACRANTTKRTRSQQSTFGHWTEFCQSLGKDSLLSDVTDLDAKLSYFVVYALRYRLQGRTNNPVRADTVADALGKVAKGFADLGVGNPLRPPTQQKGYYPILEDLFKTFRDEDSPAGRVYPCNMSIIRALPDTLDTDHPADGILNQTVIDLTIVAFYWLLRPAEYLKSNDPEARSQAFEYQHVEFTIDGRIYKAPQAPLNDANIMQRCTYAALEFTDQKNAVRGEIIGHSANDDPFFCPVKALIRICRRLKRASALPNVPLYHHFNTRAPHRGWYDIPPKFVTYALRHAALRIQATTGLTSNLLSARSLRPGGATALLVARIDTNIIQLLGRWKSDAMFRYLRVQATTHALRLSQLMLQHGAFTFAPGTSAQPLPEFPEQTPHEIINLVDPPPILDLVAPPED